MTGRKGTLRSQELMPFFPNGCRALLDGWRVGGGGGRLAAHHASVDCDGARRRPVPRVRSTRLPGDARPWARRRIPAGDLDITIPGFVGGSAPWLPSRPSRFSPARSCVPCSPERLLDRVRRGCSYITAFIGPTRRPPAVFPKYFEPFALAGLSLTGTGVGLSRFSDGER